MTRKFYSLLLAFTLSYALCAAQTSATSSHAVTLSIANAIDVGFTTGGTGVGLTFNNTANYTNGVIAPNAATLQVRSNRGYIVTVKSSGSSFSSTTTTTMPVNNILYLRESSQATYLNLSNSDQTFLSGQTQGSRSFNVSYKATPGFNYDAGTYSVNVIYTATQQ